MILKRFFIFFLVSFFFFYPDKCQCYSDKNSIKISNMSHSISSNGELLYKIKAKSGVMDDFSSKTIALDSIEITVFKKGTPEFIIFSDKGILNTMDKDLELYQNIKALSKKHTITCDKLFFKNKKKMIYLNGNIKIKSGLSSFSSNKGQYDIETHTITLKDNLEGILDGF